MKVIDEIRKISSNKIAEKQDAAKNKYPKLILRIKADAQLGETESEFLENEIDVYSKKLLEAEGFTVYATSRKNKSDGLKEYYGKLFSENVSVWVVRW